MFRTMMLAALLGLGALGCPAQALPTAPAQASHEELIAWLHGGDQRLMAWGAFFAVRNHDMGAVTSLAVPVELWQALPPQEYAAKGNYVPRSLDQVERLNALAQVLDALIQLHGTVTTQAIEQIARDFPAQAMTLFATVPEPRRTEFARTIYATRRGAGAVYDWHEFAHDHMVHLAAAILAQHPPAGFTASLLNEATVVLNVRVTDDRKVDDGGYGFGGPCGDSLATEPGAGWPKVWTYVVEEHWSRESLNGMTILVPGDPAITTRRAESNSTCSGLDWFSSAARLRLAEQEAGLPVGAIEQQSSFQFDSLAYPGARAYREAMLALIAEHTERFRQLAAALERAGALSSQEARLAMPTFRVRVLDERHNAETGLPELRPATAKIVFDDAEKIKEQAFYFASPF